MEGVAARCKKPAPGGTGITADLKISSMSRRVL
jgi:hypothetical protein